MNGTRVLTPDQAVHRHVLKHCDVCVRYARQIIDLARASGYGDKSAKKDLILSCIQIPVFSIFLSPPQHAAVLNTVCLSVSVLFVP